MEFLDTKNERELLIQLGHNSALLVIIFVTQVL